MTCVAVSLGSVANMHDSAHDMFIEPTNAKDYAVEYGSSHDASGSDTYLGPADECQIPMPQFVRRQSKETVEAHVISDDVIMNWGEHKSCDSAGSDSRLLDEILQEVGRISQTEELPDHHVGHDDDGCSETLPIEWQGKTSVCLKNVPYRFTRDMFHEELRIAGFEGTYDYMYLPFHGQAGSKGKGYAFLNFVSDRIAYKFKCKFDAHCFHDASGNGSRPLIIIPSNLQGYEDNVSHYRVSGALKKKVKHLQSAGFGVILDPNEVPEEDALLAAIKSQQQQQQQQQQQESTSSRRKNALGSRTRACGSLSKNGDRSKPSRCPKCKAFGAPEFRFCQMCGASLPW
eukprot:TRINITY_DN18383_c0_g5_i1.p1 TRINITY_DN18383_c0_g5~~TRINITY_DN18383_c0_g5_i1.p1  ORF type:complete len:361 (+),score=49.97 TRINITY_DN18383_c0_g5_i1:54-1085(+)